MLGNLLSVRLVRRVGATSVAYKCNGMVRGRCCCCGRSSPCWAAAIYVAQFVWSLGSAGFPAVQQARLVAVAPMLAAATIALNSSMTYLGGSVGATIGASAWTRGARRASCRGWDSIFVLARARLLGARRARGRKGYFFRSADWSSAARSLSRASCDAR